MGRSVFKVQSLINASLFDRYLKQRDLSCVLITYHEHGTMRNIVAVRKIHRTTST